MPEEGATAYGSGTLVDVREQFGLVITNWHVVRDSQGTVEVVFPSGFRSHARPETAESRPIDLSDRKAAMRSRPSQEGLTISIRPERTLASWRPTRTRRP